MWLLLLVTYACWSLCLTPLLHGLETIHQPHIIMNEICNHSCSVSHTLLLRTPCCSHTCHDHWRCRTVAAAPSHRLMYQCTPLLSHSNLWGVTHYTNLITVVSCLSVVYRHTFAFLLRAIDPVAEQPELRSVPCLLACLLVASSEIYELHVGQGCGHP